MSERDERQAAAQERVGRMVDGKFRLLRLLGVGGMAAVYEASHRNGKRVALKLLRPSLSTSERQRKRFLREAYAANAIDHPGVVQIHDDGVDQDGTAYLVMELLEGQTVAEVQRSHGGRLDVQSVLDIADQLLDVLAVAHAQGVIHRDIKPDNLFITTRGELKLLDLGIARLFTQVPGATVETLDGVMLGTPGFMPQEQARGRWNEVDARSDLWAVGATLFSLVTDEHVYAAETPNEQLGLAMSVPARSVSNVRSDLPESFVALVDRALAFERDARWPDARSMQTAVRACLAQSGDVVETDMPRLRRALTTASDEHQPITRSARYSNASTGGGVSSGKRVMLFAAVVAMVLVGLSFLRSAQAPGSPTSPNAAAVHQETETRTTHAASAPPAAPHVDLPKPPEPSPSAPVPATTATTHPRPNETAAKTSSGDKSKPAPPSAAQASRPRSIVAVRKSEQERGKIVDTTSTDLLDRRR